MSQDTEWNLDSRKLSEQTVVVVLDKLLTVRVHSALDSCMADFVFMK